MPTPSFDPSEAVQFDLGKGQVTVGQSGPRVLVPADALAELCRRADAEQVSTFGRRWGAEAGAGVAARAGDGLRSLGVEELVEQLGGELALMGVGSLGVERWGKVLVLTCDEVPWGDEGQALLASILEGAIDRAYGRAARLVPIGRVAAEVRFVVVSEPASLRVREWLAAGESWGKLVEKLHALGQGAAG